MKARTPILTLTLIASALLAGTGIARADYRDGDQIARARVISSVPVYDTVNDPQRECWTETQGYETRNYRSDNSGSTVLGAIVGGLVGSTVGHGNGRVAAAAVGAATGAVVGNNWNDGDRRVIEPRQVERCRTTDHVRQVVSGYDVRYRFEGREFATRLPYDPGRWLTLNVNHRIVDGGDDPRRGDWRDDD
jgi:Predicted outer membrane lipoprotein